MKVFRTTANKRKKVTVIARQSGVRSAVVAVEPIINQVEGKKHVF